MKGDGSGGAGARGYNLIQRTHSFTPGGRTPWRRGCIFYSLAVCLVRDEYESIESKESRGGKEALTVRGEILRTSTKIYAYIVLSPGAS